MTCLFVKSDVRCLNPHTAHTCCWWVVDISLVAFSSPTYLVVGLQHFVAPSCPIDPWWSMTLISGRRKTFPKLDDDMMGGNLYIWLILPWFQLVFSPELETRPGRATGQGFRTLPSQLQLRCGATCCVYDWEGLGAPWQKWVPSGNLT